MGSWYSSQDRIRQPSPASSMKPIDASSAHSSSGSPWCPTIPASSSASISRRAPSGSSKKTLPGRDARGYHREEPGARRAPFTTPGGEHGRRREPEDVERDLSTTKINYWLTKLVKKGYLNKKTAKTHTQYSLTDIVA